MINASYWLLVLTFVAHLLGKFVIAQQIQYGYPSQSDHAAYQQTEECHNGVLRANKWDCTSYFECVNGRFEMKLCPYGQNFDPSTSCCRVDYVCPNMQQHIQSDNIEQPPAQDVNECNFGDRRVDHQDCTKYFSCVGEDKRFRRRFCPQGQYFNERLNRCVAGNCQNGLIFGEKAAESGPCQESPGASGYRADTDNCHKYYQCAQSRWVHKDCPSGLVWNPTALVCDWPQKADQC